MATENPTSPTPASQELEARVKEASKIMGITPDDVWGHLAELGVDKDDMGLTILDAPTTTETVAEQEFVSGKTPFTRARIARFKLGWLVLKGKKADAGEKTEEKRVHKVGNWTSEELLKAYGPDCDERIETELRNRAKDHSFVVFDDDGKVNIPVTLELLKLCRRQDPPATYMVNGKLVRVCRVGEYPTLYVEECPLHADTILADGYCEKCQNSWKGVDDKKRVIVRVASEVENSGYAPRNLNFESIRNLIGGLLNGTKDLLVGPVELRYKDLEEENRLPILRRKTSKTAGKKDPFFQHREY